MVKSTAFPVNRQKNIFRNRKGTWHPPARDRKAKTDDRRIPYHSVSSRTARDSHLFLASGLIVCSIMAGPSVNVFSLRPFEFADTKSCQEEFLHRGSRDGQRAGAPRVKPDFVYDGCNLAAGAGCIGCTRANPVRPARGAGSVWRVPRGCGEFFGTSTSPREKRCGRVGPVRRDGRCPSCAAGGWKGRSGSSRR